MGQESEHGFSGSPPQGLTELPSKCQTRLWSFLRLDEGGVCFQADVIHDLPVDRIKFLIAAGLRASFSCSLLEAPLSSTRLLAPCFVGFPNMAAYSLKTEKAEEL